MYFNEHWKINYRDDALMLLVVWQDVAARQQDISRNQEK